MPLRITSKRAGFRRAGTAHPAATTVYPDGRFTPEQVEALKAEPMLIVEEIPAEATDPADLSSLTKAQLLALAEQLKVEIPDGAKKIDILALLLAHKPAESDGQAGAGAKPQGDPGQ